MADNRNFHLKIISPTRIFYEQDAYMLEFCSTEGEMGIYAQHVPTTVVLVPGIMRITDDQGEKKIAAVHGGFVEILKNRVTVMAEIAEWPEEIDFSRAHEAQIRAERRLAAKDSTINQARAEFALRKALIRQELSGRAKK